MTMVNFLINVLSLLFSIITLQTCISRFISCFVYSLICMGTGGGVLGVQRRVLMEGVCNVGAIFFPLFFVLRSHQCLPVLYDACWL